MNNAERVEALRELTTSLQKIDEELAARRPEPVEAIGSQPETFSRLMESIDGVCAQYTNLLGALSEGERAAFGEAMATTLLRCGSLFVALGQRQDGLTCFEQARQHAYEDWQQELARAAVEAPDAYVQLNFAQWLTRNGEAKLARETARTLTRHASAIGQAARNVVAAPRPLTSAPKMYTVNGIGTRLYGTSDTRLDGSSVGTLFFVFFFVPIFPLASYRYSRTAEGYRFQERVAFGKALRIWRWLTAAVVVAGVLAIGTTQYLDSAPRHLARDLSQLDARPAPQSDPELEGRLEEYAAVIQKYSEDLKPKDFDPVLRSIARLTTERVPSPLTPESVERATSALRRVVAYPRSYRGDDTEEYIDETVRTWLSELGVDTQEATAASLRLASTWSRHRSEPGNFAQVRRSLELTWAGSLAQQWPVAALRIYATLQEEDAARGAMNALLARLPDSAPLWEELSTSLAPWLASDSPETKPVRERIEHAKEYLSTEERKQMLEQGSLDTLTQALEKHPTDYDFAVALSDRQLAAGHLEDSLATLEKLGEPGLLTTSAQLALAERWSQGGKLKQADQLLTQLFETRLPFFESAREAYNYAYSEREEQWIRKAQLSNLPPDILRELNGLDTEKAQVRFREWLDEQLAGDPELVALREAYTAHADVVPLALRLGMVRLQLANEANGEERQRLLASAERSFLAIQSEASGAPSFHLGLGQVYHRLGKTEEGDAEFQRLLERDDPQLQLNVAEVYRELGLRSRTRELALAVHAKAPERIRQAAAQLMYLTAERLEDQETWLERSDSTDPFIQISLLSTQATRLLRAGNLKAADEKYAQVAEFHLKTAKTQASSANNAALAYLSRYNCTGEPQQLAEAVRWLDTARQLSPQNALVVSNQASTVDQRIAVDIVQKYVDIRRIRPSGEDAQRLMDALLNGPLAQSVRQRLATDPNLKKSLELWREATLLAPQDSNGYSSTFAWLYRIRDLDGLRALEKRLEQVGTLEWASAFQHRKAWLAHERDATFLETTRAHLALLTERLAQLPRSDARSRGAIRYLQAEVHLELAELETPGAHYDAALAAARESNELWPELGARDILDSTLVRAALYAVVDAEQGRRLSDEGRRWGLTATLHRAQQTQPALITALRQNPLFQESIAQASNNEEPDVLGWILSQIAENEALQKKSEAAFDDELRQLTAQISRQLIPTEETVFHEQLMRSRGAFVGSIVVDEQGRASVAN